MNQLIVTLGASADGLTAIKSFFKSVPKEAQASLVVIQHLAPDHQSLMAGLLAAYTSLPIKEVESGMEIEPGTIYLIPAGQLMTVSETVFSLAPRDLQPLPIDSFMESAATSFGNRAVAVVLAGTGSDGTQGAQAIRDKGGMVIAQDPETTDSASMPQSVIRNNLSHVVLPPEDMWQAIEEYAGRPAALETTEGKEPVQEVNDSNTDPEKIFLLLNQVHGVDFSRYKISSVSRRINRRMKMLGLSSTADYLTTLQAKPQEADALYRDLLIGVTSFFRDESVFSELAKCVIEPALSAEQPPPEFRVWIAGCASGEEAYSIAIATDEIARKHDYKGNINIFATDVHDESIRYASAGVYTKEAVENVSKERLERYFTVNKEGLYHIRPEIRKRIVFAVHNLFVDPPFSRMDLVTCRNLLIYLKTDSQKLALSSLLFSIRIGGTLMLGKSESPGPINGSFNTVSLKAKLFSKHTQTWTQCNPEQLFSIPTIKTHTANKSTPQPTSKVSIDRKLLDAYDLILNQFAPAAALINRERVVLHYFGDVAKYCQPRPGRVDSDFLSLLKGDLKLVVSTTLQRVLSRKETLKSGVATCTTRHEDELVDVKVLPCGPNGQALDLILVSFEPRKQPADAGSTDAPATPDFDAKKETHNRVLMLEDELRSTKDNLQDTVEELQSSNEELQSVNEEAQVTNEEIQSTNEELQSMNEELYTVNAELQEKNQQLDGLNKDHENLLTSTEDGVLYLDQNLRIKKFNSAILIAFTLRSEDIGRPIEDINYKLFDRRRLLADLEDVLKTGVRKEREEQTSSGTFKLCRITPFVDEGDKITGVVLTVTDITDITKMRSRLAQAMDIAGMICWDWDLQTDAMQVYTEGNCILGYAAANLGGTSATWMKRVHPDDQKLVRETLSGCTKGDRDDWACEHRFLTAKGGYDWVYQSGRVNRRTATGQCLQMVGTTVNINRSKAQEIELKRAKESAESALKAKAAFLSTMSHEIRTPLNSVCGMAELLKIEMKDDSLSQYVDVITSSAHVLLELINNILDYSKVEAGGLKLQLVEGSIDSCLSEILEILKVQINNKQLKIDSGIQLPTDRYMLDPVRLKQVLLNLISNSVKFSHTGGTVSIQVSPAEPDLLMFTVKDEGIGIQKDFIDKMFTPFTQQDGSDTRKYGGTGLGLTISKQLVELMGGTIDVSSEEGIHTTITFTIAANRVPEEISNPSEDGDAINVSTTIPEQDNSPFNVLIIDDDESNRIVLRKMLAIFKVESDEAIDANGAVGRLNQNRYDMIFMDLSMPVQSGYVLIKRIRDGECGQQYKDSIIIAFTADVSEEARERIREAKFDDVLLKPVSLKSVEQIISHSRQTQ